MKDTIYIYLDIDEKNDKNIREEINSFKEKYRTVVFNSGSRNIEEFIKYFLANLAN